MFPWRRLLFRLSFLSNIRQATDRSTKTSVEQTENFLPALVLSRLGVLCLFAPGLSCRGVAPWNPPSLLQSPVCPCPADSRGRPSPGSLRRPAAAANSVLLAPFVHRGLTCVCKQDLVLRLACKVDLSVATKVL